MESFQEAQIGDMQHRQVAGLIIGIFVVLGIIGALAAVAIPHAGQMIYQSEVEERETEFLKIQTAVMEMLRESPRGALEPIGPVTDLRQVRTADAEPLFLTDYLAGGKESYFTSGYKYSFTADGTVKQYSN